MRFFMLTTSDCDLKELFVLQVKVNMLDHDSITVSTNTVVFWYKVPADLCVCYMEPHAAAKLECNRSAAFADTKREHYTNFTNIYILIWSCTSVVALESFPQDFILVWK